MKILITGGTTFVSKYAAEYFVSKDNDVTVINRGSRPQVNGVAHISCDRTALGDRLNGKHFDLILDITAYTLKLPTPQYTQKPRIKPRTDDQLCCNT